MLPPSTLTRFLLACLFSLSFFSVFIKFLYSHTVLYAFLQPLPFPFPAPSQVCQSSLSLSFGFDVFSLLTTNRDLLTALPLPFAQSYYKGLRNKSFSSSPFLLPVLWRYDNHLTPSCSPFLQYKSYTIACTPYYKHLTYTRTFLVIVTPLTAEDTKIPFHISLSLIFLSLPTTKLQVTNIAKNINQNLNLERKHDY